MDPQIIKLSQMIHDEQYKQAERYHKGIKYGEYYTLLKRSQSYFMKLRPALTSLTSKLKRQPLSKSSRLTTKIN